MRIPRLLVVAVSLALAAPLSAQSSIEIVAEQDDVVTGVGEIDVFDNLVVNDNGEVVLIVDTDGITTSDEAILDGLLSVILQEAQALAAPAGATVKGFDSLTLNDLGESFWNLTLDGTAGSTDDSGLYFGDTLVIQEGDVSTATGFSSGTVYKNFRELKFNDNRKALVVLTVDDPGVGSTSDRAMMRIEVDGSGNLVSETVIAKETSMLPGITSVADFAQNPDQLAINNADQVMFIATGGGVSILYQDSTPLIEANTPSPVAGRDYSSQTSFGFDMNDHGDWVARVGLSGTQDGNQALIKNGSVLIQKGDTHPDISPFVITSLGAGPVHIGNAGRVLWYAAWNDNSTQNEGWFLDDRLIIQEGVTMAGGDVIYSVDNLARLSDLSDDGCFFLFKGRVPASTRNAAFLAKFFTLLPPDPGTALVVNDFTVKNGAPLERVYFAYSLMPGITNVPGCPGLAVGLQAPEVFGTQTADGEGNATLSMFVPNKASGRTVYLQAAQVNSCQVTNRVAYSFP